MLEFNIPNVGYWMYVQVSLKKYLSQEYYCPEILTFPSHEEKREGERGRERERKKNEKLQNGEEQRKNTYI